MKSPPPPFQPGRLPLCDSQILPAERIPASSASSAPSLFCLPASDLSRQILIHFCSWCLITSLSGLNAKNSKQNSSHSAAGFTQLKTFTHSSVFWNGESARRSCVLEITAGINLHMMSSAVSVYHRSCVYIYVCVSGRCGSLISPALVHG